MIELRRPRFLVLLGALAALRCATLAAEAGDNDAVRPNAQAGPFRALRADEVPDKPGPPYVLGNSKAQYREESALALDDAPAGQMALYVVADRTGGTQAILRFTAPDARTFTADPDTPVLAAEQAWEGASVGHPDAVRVDGEIRLYYSADGGIGLAHSTDGVTFTREPAPVLSTDGAAAWEGGQAPSSPSLLVVGPGDYRLFYAANNRIGEARSSDGVLFQRIGTTPLLEPEGGGSADDPPFDSEAVGEPEAVLARSEEGRTITRVYFTGTASNAKRGIGLAARFGTDGPLVRAVAQVFSSQRDARSPSVVVYPVLTLLYLTEKSAAAGSGLYPEIALGIAPGNVTIPLH